MADVNEYEPPKSSAGDTAHLTAKEILSLIPGASGLFEYFIKPPLEKRRETWMRMVAEALKELEKARFDIEKLQSDERFITIVLQSTTVAIKNHQQEKLLALRNAIINSATTPDFNEDIQLLFIRYVDELTPSHLKLLTFLANDVIDLATLKSYSQLYDSFMEKHPNTMPRDEFIMLFQDLSSRGLIRVSPFIDDFEDIYQAGLLLDEATQDELPRVIITDIAKQFLGFITIENKNAA
jgi:hypothetical protein